MEDIVDDEGAGIRYDNVVNVNELEEVELVTEVKLVTEVAR